MSNTPATASDLLTIGAVADRTGLAVSAIRFYADTGLVPSVRASSGHRRFERSVIRRLSFIQISQELGYTLEEIREQLERLPAARTPTKDDWANMATGFEVEIGNRIARLQELKDSLNSCIGCGCLSLSHCAIWNPADGAKELGAGPRYLLGNDAGDLNRTQ